MAGEMVDDSVLDAALAVVATATEGYTCNAAPTTRAEAITNDLADFTPDFGTIANGDSSGRKQPVNQVTGITIDTSDTATHIALTTGALLLYVTTCTPQALTASNTLTVNAWDIEIADPVAA